ncbi:MAG: F0F1 ATP synthase subunit delta [Gammaproteobacteria bacterium]|nr:F0F1 ATP synthase subunit delta [Gammaproteobacteria bacterium]
MADNNTIARPYARAVFRVARENNALAEVAASLDAGRQILADGQVTRFLANPSLSDEQRLEFLTNLFARAAGKDSVFAGSSDHGVNFLKLLLEYGRVNVLPEIADRFDALKADVENTLDVTVTSATALSAPQQKEIEAALKSRLGRDVNLSTEIDEGLIGGAVVRAGDVVIDGSLRARLESLSNALVS